MSFIKLDNGNLEHVSILLRPNVHFISSSVGGGVTGSQHVSSVRSPAIKQMIDLSTAADNLIEDAKDGDSNISKFNVDNYVRASALGKAVTDTVGGSTNILSSLNTYLNLIDEAPKDIRYTKQIDAFRFDPPFKFTKNTTEKNVIRNVLMPYHKHKYENCGFWYTNYNTLNFFDNDNIPSASVLAYPNVDERYSLPDSFSVNMWINPRYSSADRDYKAGTILHVSSSICLSLVSGSSVDEFGAEDTFKLLLQLSQSADIAPSTINLNSPSGAYPRDLIFTSSHFLKKNNWHNILVAWSNSTNNSTGSIFVDTEETLFHIPSASVSANTNLSPPCLLLGNYLDAPWINSIGESWQSMVNRGPTTAGASRKDLEEGYNSENTSITTDNFTGSQLAHPLNAEIHDVRIYNKFINKNLTKYKTISDTSPTTTKDLVFYVPAYFFPSSSQRSVLATPFQTITSTTNDPFSVQFSFGVGGKSLNLENYTLDFVTMEQPRHYGLFPSTINTTIQDITADSYIYDTGSNKKRNFTILPNDNGLHRPLYNLLENSVMSSSAMFKKSGRVSDYSIISLENLIPTSSLFPGLVFTTGSIFDQIVGSAPENPGVAPGSVLTIAQRTRDVSSNEITVLDISNLYYGSKIHPKSFHLYEENLTGSGGDISVNIKDNGQGGLYRADCLTKQAVWNNIGTILYEEGTAVIKTPNLFYYGKDKIDMKLRGEQHLYSLVMNIPAFKGFFMSSSNKSYEKYAPDTAPNNENLSTIHISTVNIHDDNFNVIMQANFAQPINKTEEDEFVIRLKQDF